MKKLKFRNGKFKIMQIADAQEVPKVSPDTIRLISAATELERPDFVIFTGDQLYGIMPHFRLGNAEKLVRRTISKLIAPIEDNGVPFAVTFGNHDEQCGVPNCEQAKIYADSPFYAATENRSPDDRGTFLIPVLNGKGKEIMHISAFDSHSGAISGGFEPVDREQLEWFGEIRARHALQNGKNVPCVVFQHIPVPEYYDVLIKAKKGEKNAVEAFRTRKNEYYRLPEDIIKEGGFMLESPAVPDINSGEFDALKKDGNVTALAVGHDHNNSFVAELNGIKLIYTQGSGFNAYGPGLKRGVRIFEFSESSPEVFSTHTLTFESLTNGKLREPLKNFVYTHIPTSVEQVKKFIPPALLGAGAGIASLAAMVIKRK